MSIELFEHNEGAYRSAVRMLSERGRAAVIHPTGTGKSFIAFRLCADNPDKRIVWLSPSEYIYKTQLENIRKVSPGFDGGNISFFTYAKLMLMTDEEIAELAPAYIILDEFHRAGAESWGRGVQRLLARFAEIPVLGLSATSIRYLDNRRDMADELFDGNVASEMTLGEAVVRGILTPPTYVISMYSYRKELEKYERRLNDKRFCGVRSKAQKYLDDLRRALEMADGIDTMFKKHMKDKSGKYLVFCANSEHMREMVSLAPEWFAAVDKSPHIYKAYMNNPETSRAFAKFKADESPHLKLLYCIDMLNEGVHIDDVSGVILLRPTVSPIIYKQQIGRALSASKSTEPVIFDIVNNFENLYSISAIEEEMRVAMTYYRHTGEGYRVVNEHFKIVDEVRSCREIFEGLEETLSLSWDMMYELAKRYYEENGSLEMPKDYKTAEGYSLGSWVTTQRKVRCGRQSGNLGEERIKKLDAIGMRWESLRDIEWNKYYAEAKRYYEKNGNLDVKISCVSENGVPLGRWISNLRVFRKSGIKSAYLTEERAAMLDALGMIWSVPDYLWERNYAAAMDYYRKFGNLDVPVRYTAENGVKLGQWLSTLRRLRNTGSAMFNLSDEQIKRLDAVGMCWENRYEHNWAKGYEEAKRYFEVNGDLQMPSAYVTETGFRLGAWVSNQRENAARIKAERKEKLDKIGMVWKKSDPWEQRYALAKRYYEEHGDLQVPAGYVAEGVWLNKWLNEQKQIYAGNRAGKSLTEERIRRLEEIGMCWKSPSERAWETRCGAVRRFYEEFGHIQIPKDYVLSDGRKIGNWLAVQRRCRREGRLSAAQTEMLDRLGMDWGGNRPEKNLKTMEMSGI